MFDAYMDTFMTNVAERAADLGTIENLVQA